MKLGFYNTVTVELALPNDEYAWEISVLDLQQQGKHYTRSMKMMIIPYQNSFRNESGYCTFAKNGQIV